MPGGQHKAVAVRPDRVLRIETEELLPQRVDDRSHSHRRTRMPRLRLLHSVNAQGADGVDAEVVDRTAWRRHLVPRKSNRYRGRPLPATDERPRYRISLGCRKAHRHKMRPSLQLPSGRPNVSPGCVTGPLRVAHRAGGKM